jgi:hypothetical protein
VKYIRLYVIAEGQTEQSFVRKILADHLGHYQISATARAVETSKGYRGGLTSYLKAKNDIIRWLKEDQSTDVRFTTMFDLYGLPSNFPSYETAKHNDPYKRVEILESALLEDINDSRFIPYIQIHEFETLIFADPEKLANEYLGYQNKIEPLRKLSVEKSPEMINDGVDTAPSKRIIRLIPEYSKAVGGVNVVSAIGIDKLRTRCPHFNEWLEKLEILSQD